MEQEFDLDRYVRVSKRVDLAGVRWDEVRRHPLSEAEIRVLTYMMDIESHTVIYARDLLATRVAEDTEITAFMSCWMYEEYWHGEAFSRLLGEAGVELAPDREHVRAETPYPSRRGRNAWIRRRLGGRGYASHLGTLAGSALFRDFAALQMTWGAANEQTTCIGYRRMIAKSENPVLIDLLSRIIKDERRHFAFYRAQARRRLARSATGRRVTRWAMEHLWAPVGTGVRPQAETDFAVTYLFGDPEGLVAAKEMDMVIGELPGMAGTTVYVDALLESAARLGVPVGL